MAALPPPPGRVVRDGKVQVEAEQVPWPPRLDVLDGRLRALPAGVPGDLYLGGVQLARGYLGREDLTAERFLDDPHVAGGRLYRTGDRARWRDDGALEYLGRSDHQVKLRGLRIELGEIESVLRGLPGVARAEVLLRDQDPGMPARLVAYVSGGALDAGSLRGVVGSQLPEHLGAAAVVVGPGWGGPRRPSWGRLRPRPPAPRPGAPHRRRAARRRRAAPAPPGSHA